MEKICEYLSFVFYHCKQDVSLNPGKLEDIFHLLLIY